MHSLLSSCTRDTPWKVSETGLDKFLDHVVYDQYVSCEDLVFFRADE